MTVKPSRMEFSVVKSPETEACSCALPCAIAPIAFVEVAGPSRHLLETGSPILGANLGPGDQYLTAAKLATCKGIQDSYCPVDVVVVAAASSSSSSE